MERHRPVRVAAGRPWAQVVLPPWNGIHNGPAEELPSVRKGMTMSEGCEFRKDCGFFRKFGGRQSNLWRGIFSFYCLGKGFRICERRRLYLNNDTVGSDDILPSGREVSKAFLSLN
jgi:hypothetical protein